MKSFPCLVCGYSCATLGEATCSSACSAELAKVELLDQEGTFNLVIAERKERHAYVAEELYDLITKLIERGSK